MPSASPPPPSAGPHPPNGSAEATPLPEPSDQSSPSSVTASVNTNTTSKKTYLSLLPPAQIIEICLLFEPHVPVHVKNTVWPADIEAAILELKKTSQTYALPPPDAATAIPPAANDDHASSQTALPSLNGNSTLTAANAPVYQVHPPGPPTSVAPDPDPPMGSLRDPAEEARVKANDSESGTTTAAAPSPVLQPHSGPSSANSQPQPQPGPPQAPSSHTSTPQPQAPVHPQHANLHPPAAYPYTPYPYALPQAQGQQPAYPHAPYYAPPAAYPAHYSYPYGPPPGYHTPPPTHSSPPPHAQGQTPLFSSSPLVRPPVPPSGPQAQPPPPPPPSEDLPSYEEMIVEALMDCGDSEGAAPKDLFTWMAGRYPLQTNFRPSASQALQKAYKRGRLEKRLGGKYRLNSAWEGGATSKRTTRRPQTLAQTAYAMQHPQPQSSPFTHAPLQQHQHPPAAGAQPPYANYPYSYPYGYPGYPPHHPGSHAAQAKSAAQSASAPAPNGVTINSAAKAGEEKDESGDAWEAAQHILQAINFGDLKLATQTQSTAPAAGQTGQSAQGTAGVPPPVIVSGGDDDLSAVLSALVSAAGVTANTEPPRASLTEDERAALQAQLALLAAQLTEIAEGAEEDETSGSTPAQPVQPIQAPQPQLVLAIQPPLVAPPQPSPPTQSTQASQPAPQPPPPISAFAGTHIVLDVNAFPEVFLPSKSRPAPAPADAGASTEPLAPASGHQTEVEKLPDDDSDDDDDMEDVVVPLHPHPPTQDAVRT